MKNEQAQRSIIAAALFPATRSTVPSTFEQLLTEHYILGYLTIYQSIGLLEAYQRTPVGSGLPQYR